MVCWGFSGRAFEQFPDRAGLEVAEDAPSDKSPAADMAEPENGEKL
jgi:hypothetical protein